MISQLREMAFGDHLAFGKCLTPLLHLCTLLQRDLSCLILHTPDYPLKVVLSMAGTFHWQWHPNDDDGLIAFSSIKMIVQWQLSYGHDDTLSHGSSLG